MKKFEFTNPIEEIEVAGERYKVDFSDEKTKLYHKLLSRAFEEFQKMQSLDPESMTAEELEEVYDKSTSFAKEFVDAMLGEGAFEVLYDKAGRSSVVFVQLMAFLKDVIEDHYTSVKEQQKSKYVKKAKK